MESWVNIAKSCKDLDYTQRQHWLRISYCFCRTLICTGNQLKPYFPTSPPSSCNCERKLPSFKAPSDWALSLKDRDDVTEAKTRFLPPNHASLRYHWCCREKALEVDSKYLNPLQVLHELEEVMNDDSVIVADGGDFVGSAAYILR